VEEVRREGGVGCYESIFSHMLVLLISHQENSTKKVKAEQKSR
jgi:hypothetical protein